MLGASYEMEGVSRQQVPKNFLQSLVAVVVGNAMYFLLLPYLPRAAQHVTFRFDLGLVVDFWMCLVVYGLLEVAKRWSRHRRNA